MAVVVRTAVPADRDAIIALSLPAWAPVFASLRQVLHGSGVFERQYPGGWAAAQRAAVGAACDADATPVWVSDADGGPVGVRRGAPARGGPDG